MALILDRAIMLHVPKTGGMWCHRVFFEQGILRGVLHSPENYPHPSATQAHEALGRRFTFCFVRHPVEWLRSYWAAAASRDGRGVDRIRFAPSPWADLAACECLHFPNFIDRYLARCPGAVGRLFARYTAGADFVGRQERLEEDLASALKQAGQPFDSRAAQRVPLVNAAVLRGCSLDSATATAVLRAEIDILDRYYPD